MPSDGAHISKKRFTEAQIEQARADVAAYDAKKKASLMQSFKGYSQRHKDQDALDAKAALAQRGG